MLFKVIVSFILNSYLSNAAIFMWSNHELKVSPLQEFTKNDFLHIVEKLNIPKLYVFRSPSPLSNDIQEITKGYFSIFNPNGIINMEHAIDLTGNSEVDLSIIKETIKNSTNFISAIISNDHPNRQKRDIDPDEDDTDDQGENSESGPVIYKASKMTKTNEKIYALMYSSKPLEFRTNDSLESELLGNVNDDLIIYDTRLNINVPRIKGKITLRFNFTWQGGYWYMSSVKITDTRSNRDYNLVTKDDIVAPQRFSYHCNGETNFTDPSTGAELIIYDLQVQIDSKNGKFGDANDCVPFTTAPIWSGIFITMLLGIGLIVALIAIMDIKTMDKFDNYKTKNLSITVSD